MAIAVTGITVRVVLRPSSHCFHVLFHVVLRCLSFANDVEAKMRVSVIN